MSLLNDVMRDLQTRGVPGMPPLAGLQPVADLPQPGQRRNLMLPLLAALSVAVALLLWGPGSDTGWVATIARIAGVETSRPQTVLEPETIEASEVEPLVLATGNDLRELFGIESVGIDRPVPQTLFTANPSVAANSRIIVESPATDSFKAVDAPQVQSQAAAELPAAATPPAAELPTPANATEQTTILRREPGPEDVGGIVMRAKRAMRSHDLFVAERLFREALAIDASDVTTWTYLYTVLVRSSRLGAAEQALQQGLKSAYQPAALAKLYAGTLVDRGDRQSAVSVLETHRPAPASDTEYDALLAALQQQTGKYAHAGEIYRQLLTIDPDSSAWLIGLAMSNDSLGNRPEALTGFERALESGSLKSPLDRYAQRRIAELQAHD